MYLESLESDDIYWVLPVPAIWDDSARMIMRDAAHQAGIRSDQLIIASEPEAVSIYYKKNIPAETLEGINTISYFHPGSKYIILDAGGESVDITLHEVKINGQLKELHQSSTEGWGKPV